MHVRVALVACLGALLLSASSCSGDVEPNGTLPPTSPPTSTGPSTSGPSTSTVPPAPTLPAKATEDSSAGAEAFARFWLTALDYAYQSGDTRAMRSVGECRGCLALADSVDMVYENGGHIEGGRIRVRTSRTVQLVRGRAALVRVNYSQADGVTFFPDGRREEVRGSPNLAFLFTLRRSAPRWEITAIQPVKESN
jgi:hypothetical protein